MVLGRRTKNVEIDGQMICPKCTILQDVENFRLYPTTNNRYGSCKACKHQLANDTVNASIEDFINRSVIVRRSDAKKRKIPFTIDTEYMIQQYRNQQGLCFYTDVEMTWGYGKGRLITALSLDKIIPEKGYIPGNSVFCCDIVNIVKRDFTLEQLETLNPAEWVSRARKFISEK